MHWLKASAQILAAFHHRLLLDFSHTSPTSLPVSLGHCWRFLTDRAGASWSCSLSRGAHLDQIAVGTDTGPRCLLNLTHATERSAIDRIAVLSLSMAKSYHCYFGPVHVPLLRSAHRCLGTGKGSFRQTAEERGLSVLLGAARAAGPKAHGAAAPALPDGAPGPSGRDESDSRGPRQEPRQRPPPRSPLTIWATFSMPAQERK